MSISNKQKHTYMKKYLIMLALALVAVSCDDDEDAPLEQKPPQWEYQTNTTNYRNMTLIATLPAGMQARCSAEDQMAVFAGSEIVGVARPLAENPALYYVIIGAPVGDNATLTVQYYSAVTKRIYATGSLGMFEADAMLGTATEPLILQFK